MALGPWGWVFQKTAFWLVATNIELGRPGVSHVAMTTKGATIGGRLLVFSWRARGYVSHVSYCFCMANMTYKTQEKKPATKEHGREC